MKADDKYSGDSGKLHFVSIGRELVDPIDMDGALSLAVFGVPSADVRVELNERTGEFRYPQFPSDQKLMDNGQRFAMGYMAIHSALTEQRLVAFASDGLKTYRIDRMYWWRDHGLTDRGCLADGVGVPHGLVGAQILIDRSDINAWREIAENALSALEQKASAPDVSAPPNCASRWSRLTPTKAQIEVMKFFVIAERAQILPGQDKWPGNVQLRNEYVKHWINKPGESRGVALTREPFEKWLARYKAGWRAPSKGVPGWSQLPQ